VVQRLPLIEYPETDGQPMTESDPTRDYLVYAVSALRLFFQGRRNVYVSGNLFIYYKEGNPKQCISPDVFVIFGVSKRQRRSYKTWQEGDKLPSFVLEITSRSTKKEDEINKPKLYASLGVQEYFQYDPTGDYLKPQLKGQRLVNGQYQAIATQAESEDGEYTLFSETLGLDLTLKAPQASILSGLAPASFDLRFYDPISKTQLLTFEETEEARTQAEALQQQAEQAQQQAEQERDREATERRSSVPRLLSMGLSPEQVAQALNLSIEEVNQFGAEQQ